MCMLYSWKSTCFLFNGIPYKAIRTTISANWQSSWETKYTNAILIFSHTDETIKCTEQRSINRIYITLNNNGEAFLFLENENVQQRTNGLLGELIDMLAMPCWIYVSEYDIWFTDYHGSKSPCTCTKTEKNSSQSRLKGTIHALFMTFFWPSKKMYSHFV